MVRLEKSWSLRKHLNSVDESYFPVDTHAFKDFITFYSKSSRFLLHDLFSYDVLHDVFETVNVGGIGYQGGVTSRVMHGPL